MTPETPEEALQRRIHIAALAAGLQPDAADVDENAGEEPDAPVPAPLLPKTPVLVGGNARRLEEAIEESNGERLMP
jgi:hypothetical protein